MSSCCRDLRKGRELRKEKKNVSRGEANENVRYQRSPFCLALSPPESKLRCSNRWHVFFFLFSFFSRGRSRGEMLRREMDVQGVIQHRDSGQLPRLYFPASLFLWRISARKSEHPSVLLLPRFKEKKKTKPCLHVVLMHSFLTNLLKPL